MSEAPAATDEQMDEMSAVFTFCVRLASSQTSAAFPSVIQSFLFLSAFTLAQRHERAALAVLDVVRDSIAKRLPEDVIGEAPQEPMDAIFAAFRMEEAGETMQ